MKRELGRRARRRQELLQGNPIRRGGRGAGGAGVVGKQAADLVLVRVSDDPSNARQRGQIAWAALGVTAGDEDASALVLPVDSADGLPQLGIRSRRHGTAIENDNVGLPIIVHRLEAALDELLGNGRRVSLIGAASEMDCVKPGHGPIVIDAA